MFKDIFCIFLVTLPDRHFLWQTRKVKNENPKKIKTKTNRNRECHQRVGGGGGGCQKGKDPDQGKRESRTHGTCDGETVTGNSKGDDASRGGVQSKQRVVSASWLSMNGAAPANKHKAA